MFLLILDMLIALWLWRIEVFTFESAVKFFILEFIFYFIFFAWRYNIDDDIEFDINEIENEEFRKEVEEYRKNKKF